MRILVVIFICIANNVFSQGLLSKDFYPRIEKYYKENPQKLEYIEHAYKSPLGLDTSYGRFALIKLHDDQYFLAILDSSYSLKGGIFHSNKNYYVLNDEFQYRIKIKPGELKNTTHYLTRKVPWFNQTNMSSVFGKVQSYQKGKGKYIVYTTNSILSVDTLTFRITDLLQINSYKGNNSNDRYKYLLMSETLQAKILEEVNTLIKNASVLPLTTFKELEKDDEPVTRHEGAKFPIADLVSLNKGNLNEVIKGKYVIVDLFYESCLPCHKMTGYIMEWLPTVDSSKIVIIGFDPFDSERSLAKFINDRSINYPIVLGEQAKNIANKFAQGYPTLYFISPNGTILVAHAGMSKSFLKRAEKYVSRVRLPEKKKK